VPQLPSLRRVREARLLTQQELAHRAGVHRVTIASLETTSGEARFSTVRKLAAALEVDPAELMQAAPAQADGSERQASGR
jgi:transcriptional regulator with XRE-family HTH domain